MEKGIHPTGSDLIFDHSPTLTYEEAQTLVIEIEGIINSRPLTALTDDPTSFAYLSPAHLSILRPMKPFTELKVVQKKPVNRYDIMKKLSEQFWEFYLKEMFSQSQQRTKWTKPLENLKIGQLVLIKSTLDPKRFFRRGRIIQTHPGVDGVVRYATYRLASGKEEKRHCKDLVLLPCEKDVEEEIPTNLNLESSFNSSEQAIQIDTPPMVEQINIIQDDFSNLQVKESPLNKDVIPDLQHFDIETIIKSSDTEEKESQEERRKGEKKALRPTTLDLENPSVSRVKKQVEWNDDLSVQKTKGARKQVLRRSQRIWNLAQPDLESQNNTSPESPRHRYFTRRSTNCKQAVMFVMIATLIFCTITLAAARSVNSVLNEELPLITGENELIKIQELPGGVFITKLSTLRHYKRTASFLLNTGLSLAHLITELQNIPVDISRICNFVHSDEELFHNCTQQAVNLHQNINHVVTQNKLQFLKILPLHEQEERDDINLQINLPMYETIQDNLNALHFTLAEVEKDFKNYENNFPNDWTKIFLFRKKFNLYLDLLSYKIDDYMSGLDSTFSQILQLEFSDSIKSRVNKEIKNSLGNDETTHPLDLWDKLDALPYWIFRNEHQQVIIELRVVICSREIHEEWTAISIPDHENRQIIVPNHTVINNTETNEFFFPPAEMKRQSLDTNTELMFGDITFEKEKQCQWEVKNPNAPPTLTKVGATTYIQLGYNPRHTVSACGKSISISKTIETPIQNYFYEITNNCSQFHSETGNPKIFLKATFPHVPGIKVPRTKYQSTYTFQQTLETMFTSTIAPSSPPTSIKDDPSFLEKVQRVLETANIAVGLGMVPVAKGIKNDTQRNILEGIHSFETKLNKTATEAGQHIKQARDGLVKVFDDTVSGTRTLKEQTVSFLTNIYRKGITILSELFEHVKELGRIFIWTFLIVFIVSLMCCCVCFYRAHEITWYPNPIYRSPLRH